MMEEDAASRTADMPRGKARGRALSQSQIVQSYASRFTSFVNRSRLQGIEHVKCCVLSVEPDLRGRPAPPRDWCLMLWISAHICQWWRWWS
jgi:hypothetical protein